MTFITFLTVLQRLHHFFHVTRIIDYFRTQALSRTSYTKFEHFLASNPFSRTFQGLGKWKKISRTFKEDRLLCLSLDIKRYRWQSTDATNKYNTSAAALNKTRKASCHWQTRVTLAKRLHGLLKSSGVVSCIASLPIDSLPMVSY